jgi:hypothetical protein
MGLASSGESPQQHFRRKVRQNALVVHQSYRQIVLPDLESQMGEVEDANSNQITHDHRHNHRSPRSIRNGRSRAHTCFYPQSFLPRMQLQPSIFPPAEPEFFPAKLALGTASQQAGRAHTFNFALLHTAKHGVEGGARKDNRANRGEGQRGERRKLDSTAAGTARAACLRRVSGRRAAMVELWRQAVKGDEL